MQTIAEILASKTHVFFTPEGANDFRQSQMAENLPCGNVKFMPAMDMDFFTTKQTEGEMFAKLPDDDTLLRMIREIPGFVRE